MREVKPLLFVPAHEERYIVAARALGVDIVFDLEDGCPKERRREGRENILSHARSQDWIRVSDEYEFDVRLAIGLHVKGIVVPNATPEDALWVLPDDLLRMSTIESAVGLEHAGEIARFSDALILGLGDLAVSLDSNFHAGYAAFRTVLAAKAAGIPVYAPPCMNLSESEVSSWARWVYDMGFDGMAVLHPAQIPPLRAHGRPTDTELEEARALVEHGGYRMAREGAQLIGPPHFRRAARILGGER